MVDTIIAVLGGTGPQGRGLARRFTGAGLRVILGSRDADRAWAAATELVAELGSGSIAGNLTGAANRDAAAAADLVIIAVPWAGHAGLLTELAEVLAGKVVVDCVNPLGFDTHGAYALSVPEGSATEQAAVLLPESTVVGAFHHLSAVLLDDPAVTSIRTDVMVVGDAREATDFVQELAATIPGVRGIYGGRLRNARQVEALTANLISVNRRYRAHAGVRLTDLEDVD
ncbi:MAG: NADPH-dependent F420 reductase [Nocardioides sp.]